MNSGAATPADNLGMSMATQQAQQIVRNPICSASQRGYTPNMKLYEEHLITAGTNMSQPDFSSSRKSESDPVVVACALILLRCGPKEKGFEGMKATSTGGAIKRAVVNFWRKRGLDGEFLKLPCRRFTGNPGKSSDLQAIINRLDECQKVARTNVTQRAYQETHENLRSLYYEFVQPQLGRAVRRDQSVNHAELRTACLNIMQFTTVSRGSELLNLTVRDLVFTGNSVNSPIVGVLPITKNQRSTYTYFRFERAIDVSICGLSALLGCLCVLKAHGVSNGNLFIQVTSNSLQGETRLDGCTYARLLKVMGERFGIIGLAEHSARRGGVGYHYFVL